LVYSGFSNARKGSRQIVLVLFTLPRYLNAMSRSSALRRPPEPLLPSAPAGEMGSAVDRARRRGRGTASNASGRYEPLARIAFDDGWQGLDELPPFKTTVTADSTRKIMARNDSPDISFDRSINPYRGCDHGAATCDD